MRAIEFPSIGMAISLITLCIDVALNALFIYVFKWGVFGAALSTLIGRVIETIAIAVYVFLLDQRLRLRFTDLLRTDQSLLSDYIRYGLPLIAGEVVWSVNTMVSEPLDKIYLR